MMIRIHAPRVGLLLASTLAATLAMAQTPPAKPATKPATTTPAAKPAAKPAAGKAAAADTRPGEKTSSLSGKDDGGKILSMDELRACLKQRDELTTRVSKMEAERTEMDKERQAIQSDQAQLRSDNEAAGGLRPAADALTVKFKQLQSDSDALSKRIAAFNDNKTYTQREAERERNDINATAEGLRAREKALNAERDVLVAKSEELTKSQMARKEALDARVATWNERNRKLNADGETLADERKLWTTDCGNRRYREDDEKAILAGK